MLGPPLDVRTITVGRQRLRVGIRRTPGGGRPLLLCNGLGASLEQLDELVAALPGIATIAFDPPGIGGSPAPLLPYRFCGLARRTHRLLDELGCGEVDVLGVSWGGGLAQQLAFQYPRRVRKLILVSTTPGSLMVPGRPAALVRLITPRRYVDASYRARIAPAVYGGAYRQRPELASAHLRASLPPSWIGLWYQLAALAGWTSLPWLPLLRQPTLVVAGTDDPLVPLANAYLLRALIRHAELRLVDCGHLLMLTRPVEVAAAVAEFLRLSEAEP